MKSKIALGICISIILCLSAWLRVGLPYKDVFGSGEVRFTTVDAYAHMRMADWEYEHFPEIMKVDPFLAYPDGGPVTARPLMSWLIAGISKGVGIPLDIVGAYFPAILGIILTIPVFIIGYMMFGKWAGLIGAAFVSVIPGELIGRTALGHVDHDALEMTLAIWVLTFLVLALKKDWRWAIGAGLTLGIYNLNWQGAPLFSLILMTYVVIQAIVNHCRKGIDLKFHAIFLLAFGLGLIGYLAVIPLRSYQSTYMMFFLGGLLIAIFTYLFSWLLKRHNPYWYPLSLLGFAGLVCLVAYLIRPSLFMNLMAGFSSFVPHFSGFGSTVSETMPLLWYRGIFTLGASWAYYGLCLYVGLLGLVVFLYKNWKEQAGLLLGIWTIFTVILVVLQRRYGYYAAISLGMFTGYISWMVGKKLATRKLSRADKKRGKSPIAIEYAVMVGLVVTLFLFLPNAVGAIRTAQEHPYAPDKAWAGALNWIEKNTPNPPDYSILCWWDYGYWVVREARRPVVVHPGGGNIIGLARFLLTKNSETIMMPMPYYEDKEMTQEEAREMWQARYIILDYQMLTGKWYAIPECAGYTPDKPEETLIGRLYFKNKAEGWELIWESEQKYLNQAQVKVFEYKGVQ